MEQYTQVKSSGVNWIMSIPETWGVRVLFQLADQVKNKNKDLSEQNLLSLSYGKIKRKDINNPEGLLPESFDGYNIIEADDIVLRLTDLQNDHTSLRVGQAKERGIITSAYTTLRPSGLVNPQYLYYALHAYDLIKGFYGMGSGVRQGLNYDEVKTIKIPFPSPDEQRAIVFYHDDQVSQIDSLKKKKKNSIDEYIRWKASTIFEAVTKGLDPSVNLKDSHDQGIGRIPSHWRLTKVKQVAKLNPQIETGRLNASTEVTFAPMECIRTDRRIERSALFSDNKSSYSTFNEGDIALAKVTPCFQNGNVCVMSGLKNGFAFGSSELFNIRPFNVNTRYLLYFFMTEAFKNGGIASMTGVAGLQRVSSTYIRNALLPLPPEAEQASIVHFLDRKCANIDALVSEKSVLIDDLEMYKRSLIYETVTGKRKVV